MAVVEDPALGEGRARLRAVLERGRLLEAEGLPFPTEQIGTAFEQALDEDAPLQALAVVKRGEALLARVGPDWTWVRELLRRVDDLRAIAQTIGVDVAHLDARVGHPRRRLKDEPLSAGSLEKAAASASLALAVLNDAIPKFCLQEGQQLGESIRRARNRGEEVSEATRQFSLLVQAAQDANIPSTAERLLELRRAVARIPRAPALPSVTPSEEEEILIEARNLARRLQRIKGRAQNAQSAARLMAQVRAAISEDRRYGSPEEEIEALWAEVSRLTHERKLAAEGPPLSTEEATNEPLDLASGLESDLDATPPPDSGSTDELAEVDEPLGPDPVADPEGPPEESRELPEERAYRQSLYVPYVPPDLSPPRDLSLPAEEGSADAPAGRARTRSRPRP